MAGVTGKLQLEEQQAAPGLTQVAIDALPGIAEKAAVGLRWSIFPLCLYLAWKNPEAQFHPFKLLPMLPL
eukprot:CAMPEP_0119155410 /NCGR_PEP_ID=MMETSP1310-20130426/51731_1 /TAXON_ID=464262 /ORGANISM="Genus nov. species nov., Strain RCC2339" /LENGTH=69 /DNA_ID=CAMNT_0007148007 /DNA_START=149 /DNA_END=358 /DNA_ORIENTATION=-